MGHKPLVSLFLYWSEDVSAISIGIVLGHLRQNCALLDLFVYAEPYIGDV